jgi:alkylhydroperoxidase family enzyme
VSRTHGITDEELRALAGASFEKRFTPSEETALTYAEEITLSNAVRDAVFETLRRHFSEEEIIELTATITWEICAAKFNRALEIAWAGQSTCPLPDLPSQPRTRR